MLPSLMHTTLNQTSCPCPMYKPVRVTNAPSAQAEREAAEAEAARKAEAEAAAKCKADEEAQAKVCNFKYQIENSTSYKRVGGGRQAQGR